MTDDFLKELYLKAYNAPNRVSYSKHLDGLRAVRDYYHHEATRPEVEPIEITMEMEEAGMAEVEYQYNLPSTRAGVVAVFRAMLAARQSPPQKG